ncbi:hypothetical protein FJP62_02895 [Pantoea vagans]|nr:hypothetical protein FJP62_02895 [Pantoea vagans]
MINSKKPPGGRRKIEGGQEPRVNLSNRTGAGLQKNAAQHLRSRARSGRPSSLSACLAAFPCGWMIRQPAACRRGLKTPILFPDEKYVGGSWGGSVNRIELTSCLLIIYSISSSAIYYFRSLCKFAIKCHQVTGIEIL